MLSIKMNWDRWTKRIIKSYRISRKRLNRGYEDIMKLKGSNLWMYRKMRSMMVFRAVKDAKILFVLMGSGMGMLRSVLAIDQVQPRGKKWAGLTCSSLATKSMQEKSEIGGNRCS